MIKCLLSVVMVSLVLCAVAEEVVWTNGVATTADWRRAANWTDGSGQPLAEAPIGNADQSATFVRLSTPELAQEIDLAARLTTGSTWDWETCVLPSLAEASTLPSRRTLNISTAISTVGEYGVWLVVQDIVAPDFLWKFANGQIGLRLPSTGSKTIAVSHVSPVNGLEIEVPTSGTKATIETVHDGVLVKRGAGELEVKTTSGLGARFHVTKGTLTLDGSGASEVGDDVPVPGAWMHLDADNAATRLGYTGDDGRHYVTNWSDVRGNGTYAYLNTGRTATDAKPAFKAPFLNTTLIPGRTVMDFGRAYGDATQDPALGPVGCALDLCRSCSYVREVFFAIGRTQKKDGSWVYHIPPLGEESQIPFLPGSTMIIATKYMGSYPVMGNAAYGDIFVDGERTSNTHAYPNEFGIVSIGLTNRVEVSVIASDRRSKDCTGGIRLGEILVYTNTLTHAERLAVHRYLQHKWTKRTEPEDLDAGSVTLANDASVAISVPANHTAKIGEVASVGGTVVKTGEGVLKVGSLEGKMGESVPSVDVRGGAVTFGGLASVSSDEPASGAWVWLDATKGSTFVYEDESTKTLSEWHDCRADQTAIYAKKPTGKKDYVEGKALPVVTDNVVGEKSVVDFGDYTTLNDTSAFMQVGSLNSAYVYEAFIVQRFKTSNAFSGNIFGSSSGTALMRGSASMLLRTTYGKCSGRAALWTVNGAVTDPVGTGAIGFNTDDFNVFSVSSSDKLFVDLLGAKDRLGQGSYWGGVQVGEFLAYDRKLTSAERRQTIAYLMNKWQGRMPTFARDSTEVSKLSFAADKPAVLESDSALTVGAVGGSNGTIVKRGAGSVSIGESLKPTAAVFSVEAGRLEARVDYLNEILAKTAFHFDATDIDSMTYTVEDRDGKTVTNVTKIADQRVAGLTAKTWTNPTETKTDPISFSDPTLVTVQTADGVTRTVLDFGDQNIHGSRRDNVHTNAAGMRFTTTFDNIREAHTIFADTDAYGNRGVTIISDDSTYNYLRGGSGKLIGSASYGKTVPVRDGLIYVDDEAASPDDVLPAGHHLFSAVPTESTSVGAIGVDRNIVAGGCQVGELLGFTEALPSAESAYLRGCLMAKWFGTARPAWTNDIGAVSVEAGATLSFGTDAMIRPMSLAGGGTIEASRVIGEGNLSIVAGAPLQVSGVFAQGGPVAVSVDFSKVADKRGTLSYDIVAATAFDNLDLSAWTLVSDLPRRGTARFCREGNRIVLKINPFGTLLIVR